MEGWHPAPDFAEEAEALGLTTNHIAAVADEVKVVTYSLNETDDPNALLFAAVLLRGHDDGILRAWIAGIPIGTLRSIQDVAFRRHGPPPGSPENDGGAA
jgi:hypothetical protein